jgi:endonuclease YncB( thermonuclease family)
MSIASLVQRRRRIRAAIGGVLGLLLIVCLADNLTLLAWDGNDWKRFDRKPARVVEVTDGDTIVVETESSERATVRLIGVDAPEMNFNKGEPAYFAERAMNYTIARSKDKTVTLRLDTTQTRDRYGRLLAYVYLPENDLLNQALIRDGQAYADRRFPHLFRPQFEQAEGEARGKKRGLWKEVTEEQMPQWRQNWLARRTRTKR